MAVLEAVMVSGIREKAVSGEGAHGGWGGVGAEEFVAEAAREALIWAILSSQKWRKEFTEVSGGG